MQISRRSKMLALLTLVTSLSLIFISLFCYIGLRSIIIRNEKGFAGNYVTRCQENIRLEMQLVENSCSSAADSISDIPGNDDLSITYTLDGIQAINPGITGVSLYMTDGRQYFSETVFSPPDRDKIFSDPDIEKYSDTYRHGTWLCRNTFLPLYEKNVFSPKNGVISYISFWDDGSMLIVDMNSESFFTGGGSGSASFAVTRSLLYNDNGKVMQGTRTKPYLLVFKNRIEDTPLIYETEISVKSVYNDLLIFFLVTVAADALLLIPVFLIYRRLAGGIFDSLGELYVKIKNEKLNK